jgi:hypothetical protein
MRTARILTVAILALLGIGSTLSSATAVTALAPALASVTVTTTDVVGGTTVGGTVTLTAAAPVGGTAVDLSSDNPAVATVPASVLVPAGSTSVGFEVTTFPVTNSQSAIIIGTTGGVTTYAIVTVRTPFAYSNGSVSVLPAGNGSGTVSSQPAGISCAYNSGVSTGTCSAFFPVGTVVRLTAKAGAASKLQGWRGLPGCGDPSKITVGRGSNITCQPGFSLK